MPTPRKRLSDLVRDETFLGRRHAQLLLDEPLVRDPGLRLLQERYRAEPSELERRRLALQFERAVRDLLERERALQEEVGDETLLARIGEAIVRSKLSVTEFWYAALGPGFGNVTGARALGFRRRDGSVDWAGFGRLERRWRWWDSRYGTFWRYRRGMAHHGDTLKLVELLTGKRPRRVDVAAATLAELHDQAAELVAGREPLRDPPGFELLDRSA
jgi:hypothetical protein